MLLEIYKYELKIIKKTDNFDSQISLPITFRVS